MKHITTILLLAICLVSCSKSDIDRANELIAEHGLDVRPASSLDSLNYYRDCLELRIKAAQITHEADSTMNAGVETAKAMKSAGQTEVLEGFANNLRDNCVAMYRVAFKYTQDANFGEFQHNLAKDPKEFLGYKCEVANDSLAYVVVFDKEITKIVLVEKNKK